MMKNTPTTFELKGRLDNVRLQAARLAGVREADTRQLIEWTDKVSQAKARMSLEKEMTRLFEALQNRAHSRSVGSFEALLSAVLNDVLPGQGNVKLELSSSNSTPNLDLYINNDGNLENILDNNGGAVTNVICTGLRYAALSRTKNRRLMVLDEPDCWMKPEHIPDFMRVIAEVSNTTKTQTLLISHHETPYFKGRMNVVELKTTESGKITATASSPLVTDWESPSQRGLRSIRLVNVGAHIDTTLPLYPGATAFIGDNNLGKSTAISTATKAVAYNTSDDTIIRHGADMAQITHVLENNRRLVWTRRRKGSPKVVYALYEGDSDVPLKEGKAPARGSVPDWVKEELGISEVDDLDLQVGSQKEPVFLLNEPASRRARLLSVGRESGHLVQLMKSWGAVKRTDMETIKEGELRVAKLRYKLDRMNALDTLGPTLVSMVAKFDSVETSNRNFGALHGLLDRFAQSSAAVKVLDAEVEALRTLPGEAPELAEVTGLQRLITRIAQVLPYKDLQLPILQVEVPELADTQELAKLGGRIAALQKYRPLFQVELPLLPNSPELSSELALKGRISQIEALASNLKLAQKNQEQVESQCQLATADLNALKEKIGGICPLCDQKFEKDSAHVHVE